MNDDPQLEKDAQYILQALNIHGTFFERRCQEEVRNTKEWKIQETNYPVEHRGEASNLDIWAETTPDYKMRIELLIECKKNNPDFIDWVFFPQPVHRSPRPLIRLITVDRKGQANSWKTEREFRLLTHNLIMSDEARETKGDYQKIKQRDWTKTSNAAITDAAKQVVIAIQSLIAQEFKVLEERKIINQKENTGTAPLGSG
jgi:hypothetical protein